MFGQLLESGVHAPRRPVWTATSAAVHIALVALAITLTLRHPDGRVERVRPDRLVYVAPRAAAPAPAPAPQRETGSAAPSWRLLRDIPIALPAVPPVALPWDAPVLSALIDTLGPGLIRDGRDGRDGRDEPSAPRGDRVYAEHMVDRTVVPRNDNPSPAYPATLSASQVEGEVLVQFVVDTTGRVEPQSIVILRATHRLFGESVQRWLPRTRYSPAEGEGHRVRQLVQQQVGFTLRP